MPKIERKLEINASQKRIFDILNDTMNYPKWNIVVNEVTEIEPGKTFSKTNIGDITSTRTETVPNERISMTQEGSPMTAYGLVLTPKGDVVEATIWAEFDDEKNEKMLLRAGEVYLQSLKKYAEYLENGGNPDQYSKK